MVALTHRAHDNYAILRTNPATPVAGFFIYDRPRATCYALPTMCSVHGMVLNSMVLYSMVLNSMVLYYRDRPRAIGLVILSNRHEARGRG